MRRRCRGIPRSCGFSTRFSGSMTAQVAGQTKISLANQGAVLAMNVLQPRDFFGVTAVDTRPHVVAPLAQVASKGSIEQKILSITAGGNRDENLRRRVGVSRREAESQGQWASGGTARRGFGGIGKA